MFSKYKYLFIALLWTVVITVLSLISLGNIEQTLDKIDISNKDKYVHFTFYFVFVVLWFLQIKNKPIDRKTQIIILLSAIGYGIFMEICQGFTETRTPDIMDIDIDNATIEEMDQVFEKGEKHYPSEYKRIESQIDYLNSKLYKDYEVTVYPPHLEFEYRLRN